MISSRRELIGVEGSSFILTDETGKVYLPRIDDIVVESRGPIRATIKLCGQMQSIENLSLAKFIVRLSFFADSGFVQAQVTLHNLTCGTTFRRPMGSRRRRINLFQGFILEYSDTT